MKENTYYTRNREHASKVSLEYYHRNKELINAKRRGHRKKYPNAKRCPDKYRRERAMKLKTEILNHYGNDCVCCGESNAKLLTVDHIDNNGKEHGNGNRRYTGAVLYSFLIKSNFPCGIQILCFNCNIGRQNNGGSCPHKESQT